MVLDFAESVHRCVVTRPGLVLRPGRIPPGRAPQPDGCVVRPSNPRAFGRDLVKLLHCSLDVSRLRLGHSFEALKAVLPELLGETAELLRILGLAHLES